VVVDPLDVDGTSVPSMTSSNPPSGCFRRKNDAVTKVRRRVIWKQQGRRGRKVDPAWANRRRLLTSRDRLLHKAFATTWNSLIDSDPSGHVRTAWIAKEELRALFGLAGTDAHRDQHRSASSSSARNPAR